MKKLLSIILACAMLLSVLALPAMATTETDDRIWFDLNGNSRFFVQKGAGIYENRTSYKDYLPGVDFAGFLPAPTGDFATDQPLVKNPGHGGAMFAYTVDKNTKGSQYAMPDFTTGEDSYLYWTINDVKYRINTDENVIKVCKNAIDTSALADADMTAKYNSINKEAVIDIEDGKYKNIGLVAGLSVGNTRKMVVTLVYEDTTEEKTIDLTTGKASAETSYLKGYIYLQNFTNSNSSALGGHQFIPYTIEPDPTKTLTAVKINDGTKSSSTLCIYVVSAWGEKAGSADFISAVAEMMADGIGDVDEYKTVKAYMELINEEELTEEQKAVYNDTLSALTDFEANLEEMEKEAQRQEAMTKRTYKYLTLNADRDVFATWKDITDLSRFYYNAEGTVNTAPEGFNTATYDCDGTTIFSWIPHDRADGTKVTGQEAFYFKGLKNISLPQLPENGNAPAAASYVYLLDDITNENGTTVAGTRIGGLASSGDKAKYGADEYYTGANDVKRASTEVKKTVKNPDFSQKLDENGYFIIKKDAESKTNYKIGPVAKDSYSPNAQLVNSSINNVNAIGTTLDVLITTTNINYNTTYFKKANSAVNAYPVAALQQVIITYEDGEIDTKYIAVTDNRIASYDATYSENPVIKSIVFASKYDEQGNEIKYDGDSFYANKDKYDFKVLKGNLATVGLDESVSADAVSFKNPDVIMGANTKLAQVINLRQDAMHNNYGAFSTSASLPLENKKVEAISFPVNQSAALNASTAIPVIDGAKDAEKSTIALLPVEIEGASDRYVYFAYLGRSTSETYIMAATVTENSSNEKLAAAEAAMSKITVNSTMLEAKKALELYNIAEKDTYLKESDFNTVLVESFMNTFKTIRDNYKPTGKISVKYYNGEKPTADVEMNNYAEVAGKTYQVILAYYNEKGNYLGSDIFDKETTEAEKETYTVTGENCPENTVKVKGFVWNGLDKLIPLAEADETEKKSTFKVLSIGNSYSNNAHKYLAQIAADAGFEKVQIANLFIGGCSIKTHYENAVGNKPAYSYQYKEIKEDGRLGTKTIAESTMLDGILAEEWDVITIQQQSLNSGVESSYVKEQIDYLVNYVNENKTNKDAKVVWHMTWPYASYYTTNSAFGTHFNYSTDAMYQGIVSAVQTHIAPRKDFDYIIPAGTAVQNARLLKLDDVELSDDGTHLSDLGCYVIGLTWFAKITGKSIDDITYMPVGDPADLPAIKTAVKNAIANPYEVTK